MHTIFYVSLLLLFSHGNGQAVDDSDKRSFDELAPIYLDLDGDGRRDTIQPRTYARRHSSPASQPRARTRESHWITFDLELATGTKRLSFFRYRYGADRDDYWVGALKAAGDLNRDGRTDLVFYSGDDTTDETVLLLQGTRSFTASSSGLILCDLCVIDRDYNVVALGQYDVNSGRETPNRIVARWNPHRGYFDGDGLYWIRARRAPLREEPLAAARVVEWFEKDDAVAAKLESGRPVVKGKWVLVETEMGSGWMDRGSLVTSSRWVQP